MNGKTLKQRFEEFVYILGLEFNPRPMREFAKDLRRTYKDVSRYKNPYEFIGDLKNAIYYHLDEIVDFDDVMDILKHYDRFAYLYRATPSGKELTNGDLLMRARNLFYQRVMNYFDYCMYEEDIY